MTSLPPALPPVRSKLADFAAGLDRNEARRLIEHESMRVYFDVGLRDDLVTLHELETTTARAELILPTLAGLIDSHGPGMSVIDLACSPGYFMFKLAQMGLTNVSGVDARADHHAQFDLLQGAFRFPGLRHVHEDIYDFLRNEAAADRSYDVCLLFGFLYHTATPVELLRLIRAVCRHVLVLDTTVSRRSDASLQFYEEPTAWSRASTTTLSLMPSLRAVPMLLEAAGFGSVERISADPACRGRNPGGDKVDYYFDQSTVVSLRNRLAHAGRRLATRFGLARERRFRGGRALYVARVEHGHE